MHEDFSPALYRYVRTAPVVLDSISKTAAQFWDVVGEDGKVLVHAEIFEGKEQWGVRVFDRAPHLDDATLVRLVAHVLVWHASCPTETVDVVLFRTQEHHTLVRVAGDYV